MCFLIFLNTLNTQQILEVVLAFISELTGLAQSFILKAMAPKVTLKKLTPRLPQLKAQPAANSKLLTTHSLQLKINADIH